MAELRSQIDADRTRAAKERAGAELRNGDDAEAQAALRRADVRLAAVEGRGAHALTPFRYAPAWGRLRRWRTCVRWLPPS
ncbi:MAG TPA: ATP synthase delta/epsilon chain alpha-helix domain-containing protein [Acidimicrobiales bacterium]|nr:ATP synthase delta/epsilon chain alpha-helix domain-containing protein [Acidimicrobiales bacterium]